MHKDCLIIGQGIAGTLLSYELIRAGKSVMLIDAAHQHKASLVASAVMNPLIGKNWTRAKDAELLIPAAIDTYSALGELLGANFILKKNLLVFHQSENDGQNFAQQIGLGNPYLEALIAEEISVLKDDFFIDEAVGKVTPVYTIDAAALLVKWQNYLQAHHSFSADKFDFAQVMIAAGKVHYKDFSADQIVFCEGAVGRENYLFPNLNFTTNRGDVLLLSIPGLDKENLYQQGIRVVPRSDGLFWCGSNYTWKYESLLPDMNWRMETETKLKSWLKLPFKIIDHLVAERPTTAGQIPVLLQHETQKNVYFFNGLGTRGFSAGPSLAKEMAALMLNV